MREIIFKYELQSKQDNEILTVFAPLYSEKNGTMQFPIELDKWKVISIKQYIGRKDSNNNQICEGNKIKFKSILYNKREFEGIVKWNDITCSFYIDRGVEIGFNFNADTIDIEIIEYNYQ